MRRSGEVPGYRGGIALTRRVAESRWQYAIGTAVKVAFGALAATALSTLVVATLGTAHGDAAPHAAFLVAAGAIGIVLGSAGHNIRSIDPGLLFTFFVFEPIGLTLLHKQTAPPNLGLTLALAVTMACFFSHRHSRKERTRELVMDVQAATSSGKRSNQGSSTAIAVSAHTGETLK